MITKHTELLGGNAHVGYCFMEYEPESEEYRDEQYPKKQFIRIFKDEVSPEIWASYCMGLGIRDTGDLKSFKIYLNPDRDIKLDEYNESGELKN